MRERPILFSGPMVRALLDGRKTQTRRLQKPQPVRGPTIVGDTIWRGGPMACPFGVPGDRLWVRETWALATANGQCDAAVRYRAGPAREDGPSIYPVVMPAATDRDRTISERWRPSIHMPRWASRITLELTAVRVERLQDISAKDAIKEGLSEEASPDVPVYGCPGIFSADFTDPRDAFRELWDSQYGGSPWRCWDDNPWVWVLEFKRVTT